MRKAPARRGLSVWQKTQKICSAPYGAWGAGAKPLRNIAPSPMGKGLGVGRSPVRQHQKMDFIDKLSPPHAGGFLFFRILCEESVFP